MCCEYQETINGEKLTVFFDIRNQLYVFASTQSRSFNFFPR